MSKKKNFSFKHYMLWLASLVGLVAFVLSFFVGVILKYSMGIKPFEVHYAIDFNKVVYGLNDLSTKPLVLSIIGFILVILSAVGLTLASFKKKENKIIVLLISLIGLVGAIFTFLTPLVFKSINSGLILEYEDYVNTRFVLSPLGIVASILSCIPALVGFLYSLTIKK